jgi:hypothetical protein
LALTLSPSAENDPSDIENDEGVEEEDADGEVSATGVLAGNGSSVWECASWSLRLCQTFSLTGPTACTHLPLPVSWKYAARGRPDGM